MNIPKWYHITKVIVTIDCIQEIPTYEFQLWKDNQDINHEVTDIVLEKILDKISSKERNILFNYWGSCLNEEYCRSKNKSCC